MSRMNRGRFAGRVAVVTGGGSGIGRATALALAREGATTIVVDIDEKAATATVDEAVSTGGEASAVVADMRGPEGAALVAGRARESGSALDILVNAAGVLRRGPAEYISEHTWRQVLDTNLTGPFFACAAAYPIMKERGYGRIVNVASMAGRATSTLGGAHYTAAKAGLLGLTRHLAREWTSHGITVNAVSPGIIKTPMVDLNIEVSELARVLSSIPSRRLGDPEEVADLICFLASDEASYITGTNVDIHGGELIIQ